MRGLLSAEIDAVAAPDAFSSSASPSQSKAWPNVARRSMRQRRDRPSSTRPSVVRIAPLFPAFYPCPIPVFPLSPQIIAPFRPLSAVALFRFLPLMPNNGCCVPRPVLAMNGECRRAANNMLAWGDKRHDHNRSASSLALPTRKERRGMQADQGVPDRPSADRTSQGRLRGPVDDGGAVGAAGRRPVPDAPGP